MNIATIDDEVMTFNIAYKFGAYIRAQVHHYRKYVVREPKYLSQFLHTHISTK
jgi:hypothetical protein